MRNAILLPLLTALLLGCAPADAPVEQARPELTAAEARTAIALDERFSEPIWIEVWGHQRSPSAQALERSGLLQFDEKSDLLQLTDRARASDAKESFFQDDIPVFLFPVGRREIVDVRAIDEPPGLTFKRVRFDYRRSQTPLGASLASDGARVGVDADALLQGTAFLNDDADGWKVLILEL